MKTHGGVEEYLCAFLTSALDGGEWSSSHFGRFTPEKIPGALVIELLGLTAGLEAVAETKISLPCTCRSSIPYLVTVQITKFLVL
jgi:hypothetical protein